MGKPQVTLTLAGDESKLTKSFDKVGGASRKLASEVGGSSKRMAEETTSGFDRAGEAADGTYSSFDALESVGRGTGDTMTGLSEIMSGNILQGSTDLAGGVAALADGFQGALLPAIKKVYEAGIQNVIATGRQTVANVAAKAASIGSAIATNAMTVAQKALNLAMRMNPIGLIITALTLLVGGLIYAYKHSETFRNIVNAAFRAVLGVVQAVVTWIRNNWPLLLKILTGPIGLAVSLIRGHKDSILGFFKAVPGAIAGFFKGVANTISAPYRAAFGAIKSAWNNTVGGKGFNVPGWIPGLGGKSFTIPYFHSGGVVSGSMGSETLAVLKAGERVTGGRNSGEGTTILLQGDGSAATEAVLFLIRKAIGNGFGGDVQVALGPAGGRR